jgi:hypothetical protein
LASDGKQYQPPCYFAKSWDDDDVPRPFEDTKMAEQLQSDFGVTRDTEPGLSVVIP